MRLRALPPSFWQQPNVQPNVAPSAMYLPPLFKNVDMDSAVHFGDGDIEYGNQKSNAATNQREVRISPANTDLLFKLFEQVDQQKDSKKQLHLQMKFNKLANPRQPLRTTSLSKTLIKGEDPCIVDSVTEGLFPLLRLDSRSSSNTINETGQYMACNKHSTGFDASFNSLTSNGLSNSSPVISSNSSSSANGNNSFSMLQFEQNYSQVLSDVVAAL